MSKKYRGKTCTYCASLNSSTTGDHVVGRGFFTVQQRGDLPQVPACARCNSEKSALEHYLMTVLPFGGRHPDASTNLAEQVPGRLKKNAALANELRESFRLQPRLRLKSFNGGPWTPETVLAIRPDQIIALYRWIAMGLSFEHWDTIASPRDFVIAAAYLTASRAQEVDRIFEQAGEFAVHGNLGNGTFVYSAFQHNGFSIWRMSIYGAELATNASGEVRVSNCYVYIAPRGSDTALFVSRMFGEQPVLDPL
jgi:hypothetical protein